MDYWEECVSEAMEVAGLNASSEQIKEVAKWVESGHECYGQMHGHEAIPDPMHEENKRLRRELNHEKGKVVCPSCKGSGEEVIHGPFHTSYSDCPKCRGDGKVA